ECYRVLRPRGLLVLMHSDWDTTLVSSDDDALTRQLVDRFVAAVPKWAQRADGFMGRKLLGLATSAPFEVVTVDTWADCHRRFDENSVAWKVARGVLALGAGRGELLTALARLADEESPLRLHGVDVVGRPPLLPPVVGWSRADSGIPFGVFADALVVAWEVLDTVPCPVLEIGT